ncbi:exopolysaccharide biosynthesis protein [Candidatus Nitrotoga sp. BS]|uniref:exopolysaccharide biosynthesis protein n=1 Tax=Candidatus Nitrotoga sp. BS TaxID=2890408 RepID=UPI001EF16E85|nr:exopolysaccharide biosynthesis protein [Candidatus Nitrotoga sp. BS]
MTILQLGFTFEVQHSVLASNVNPRHHPTEDFKKMQIRTLSKLLVDLKDSFTEQDNISIDHILKALQERSFGFMLFIFALPAALPLPGLGINLIIAAPLLFLTAQQALGRDSIWFPKMMRDKSISRERFDNILNAALPFIRKIELLVKPRLDFVTQRGTCLIGLCGLIMALSVCIPLPLTNTVPSAGIALMAIGVIMRDGLAIIAGALLGLLWVAMLGYVLVFLGTEGLDAIKETIKSFL